jgi:hypothetical protein
MQLDTLSIEQLADLRDKVIATLNDRVSARQRNCKARSTASAVSFRPNPENDPQRVSSGW